MRIKVKDIVCNDDYDTNCRYRIYYGTWDNKSFPMWDSENDGRLSAADDVATYNVSYITVVDNILIIEVL